MSSGDDSTHAAVGSGVVDGLPVNRWRKLMSRRALWPLFGAIAVAAVVLVMALRSSDAGESAVQPPDTGSARVDVSTEEAPRPDRHDGTDESGPDPTVYDTPLPDAETAWLQIASEISLELGRRYSDEELGLYELIDEVVFYRPYYARHRTFDDFFAGYSWRNNAIPTEVEGHERERLQFELDLDSVLSGVYAASSADLTDLELAFDEWMAVCAAQAGYEGVVLDDETEEELALYASDFDLSPDAFDDLRFNCAQQAASYPTLDPDTRGELIYRVRKHYLRAVHDYIRDFDVVEIPVEHHEGMVHPLEESYVQRCLEREVADRQVCAEHYRVELTEEQRVAPVPERVPEDESKPYPLVGKPCLFIDAPGLVVIDREGRYCDMFENLEFTINHPETKESQDRVSNHFRGGKRLLVCPDDWVIDDTGKCRYPRPEEASLRAAFIETHPEHAGVFGMGLFSDRYRDKD